MSQVDLNNLQLQSEVIDIPWDDYVEPTEFAPPAPAGIDVFKQGKPKFEASKDKFLVAIFDHVIDDGPNKGSRVAFDRVSNKTFERQGVKASMMADQLRAVGETERPRTHQEYADLISKHEGSLFKAAHDWEGYCTHKGTPFAKDRGPEDGPEVATQPREPWSLKGMKNFPSNGGGQHIPTATCDVCKQNVNARSRITRRIPHQA